ncbi:MAG: outer membrane protein assembly factor BamA [Deltaproteobacteria bacterium]|nr:outer membrane protein assembly factor BamA [Deltaproteobacteria bacterium]
MMQQRFTIGVFLFLLCSPIVRGMDLPNGRNVANGRSGIVQSVVLHGLDGVAEDAVLGVLTFQQGDRFREEEINKSVALLKEWGRFSSVDHRITRRNGNYEIHFLFTPARLIGEINIHGNYPLLERRVRRQLEVRPGDLFNQTLVEAQADRIQAFYQRLGYFDTMVGVRSTWRDYRKEMAIDYTIHRGRSLRWGAIAVDDRAMLPIGRIRTAFPLWGFYSPRSLRRGMDELERYYHRHGYPKARIRLVTTAQNPQTRRMDLALQAHVGPHVTVRFVGNASIADADLKRQVTFFREGRYDRYEVENTAEALRAYYMRRGFVSTEISFERDRPQLPEQTVTFHIVEGPQRHIWGFDFVGNAERGDATLRKQILTRPLSLTSRGSLNPETLAEDLAVLEDYYAREGFLDVDIGSADIATSREGRFFDITLPVEEGREYRVGKIVFLGNMHSLHDDLTQDLQLRPEEPANLSELEHDRQQILLYFNDHGFPYATVTQKIDRHAAAHRVDITYSIDEGPPVTIGQMIISGDFITSQKAIRRAMRVKTGAPYSDRKILESLVQLRRLGAFRNVSIERIGLAEQKKVVHLAVHVEEERPFLVDIDLGYSTDDRVTGELHFTNINAFGWAKRMQLSLIGGQERARGEIAWYDPNFATTDLLFTSQLFADRNKDRAFDLVQLGGALGLYRQYHRTSFNLRYQLAKNRILGGATSTLSRRDTTLSELSFGAAFDTRDSYANPTRGVYLFGQSDLVNELAGEHDHFITLQGGASHYLHLGHHVVFSQYGRLGGIIPIGSVSVPIQNRFFLGGDDTIRGFVEDGIGEVDANGAPVGNTIRWIYNAELSATLGGTLQLVGFFDAGSLTNAFASITSEAIRESAGVGVRYITPVGPIRADYSIKLDPRPGEGRGRIHFTFGHVF